MSDLPTSDPDTTDTPAPPTDADPETPGAAPPAADPEPSPAPRRLTGWRRWVFPLAAALVIPALLLGALELGLRLAGYGVSPRFFLPIEGRTAPPPEGSRGTLLTTNPKFGWRFFPPAIARTPAVAELGAEKPDGTVRIFILGGSAAMGTPDAGFGFGRSLQAMLEETWPEVRFEVVNAAMTAINSHVVLSIARECSRLEPDLFLVYLGNNEVVGPYGPGTVFRAFSDHLAALRAGIWLRGTRTGQLLGGLTARGDGEELAEWEGMEMFAERRVAADDPRLEAVYAHLAANLEDLLDAARGAGARVVVATVATNLLDNPPFASLHREDLSEDERGRWQEVYDRASGLLGGTEVGEEQVRQAAQLLEQAAEIDDRWAELHFLLGHAYRALGRGEDATRELVLARDLDALRFRADSRINETIRTVARDREDEGVYLLDAESLVPGSPLGASSEIFWEHVHLNLEGNYRLARAFFERMPALLGDRLGQGGDEAAPQPPSRQQVAERLGLTDRDRHQMAVSIRDMMERPPFTGQLSHRQRARQMRILAGELGLRSRANREASGETYRRSLEDHPEDLPVRARFAQFLQETGRLEDATAQLDQLLARLPGVAEWRTRRAFALADQAPDAGSELLVKAAAELEAVLADHPESPDARINLATVLEKQGELDRAEALYRETVEDFPASDLARFNLATLRVRRDDLDGAAAVYREALEHDPDSAAAHGRLGGVLERQEDFEGAEAEYRRALELDPDLVGVRNNLGYLLERRGRRREAAEAYAHAIDSDPTFPLPYFNLADLLLEQGLANRAVSAYRAGLDLAPGNLQARFNLALALGAGGDSAASAAELERILAAAPEHPGALANLAWLLVNSDDRELRDPQRAVGLAEKAVEVSGGEPQALETLALAYAAAGRRGEARQTAARAVEAARARGDDDLHAALEKRLERLLP